MSDHIKRLIKVLELHSIPFEYSEGVLYALEVGTENGNAYDKWVDVTEWTTRELLEWLGY